jgi:hypothetical protein
MNDPKTHNVFVDFATPDHAAAAIGALQGYVFDLKDPNPHPFAAYPMALSSAGATRLSSLTDFEKPRPGIKKRCLPLSSHGLGSEDVS